jgi:hypothetical protein
MCIEGDDEKNCKKSVEEQLDENKNRILLSALKSKASK